MHNPAPPTLLAMQAVAAAEAQAEALRLSMETLAMENRARQLHEEAAALHRDAAALDSERDAVARTTVTRATRCDEAAAYYHTMARLLATVVACDAGSSRSRGGVAAHAFGPGAEGV